MTLYLDSSVLVAACAAEPASDRVRAWLLAADAEDLAISLWVETEFAAAIAMKVRSRRYTAEQAGQVMQVWRTLRASQLTMIEIEPAHFMRAAAMAGDPALRLRAGDALHLAICENSAADLATLDEAMFEAAIAIGLNVVKP